MNGMCDISIGNFFKPRAILTRDVCRIERATVILPTYKPHPTITVRLVRDILRWNKKIKVVVVDDCTPTEYENTFHVFKQIKSLSERVTYIRTPVNKLKAGAINFALSTVLKGKKQPEVIITMDDDVLIEEHTLENLIEALSLNEKLGVVCSQCRVLNKDKNILTRLQGLEYLGFNAVRLADMGFFHGPLVMPGMLSAFRVQTFYEVGFFSEGHLIEDYEMTSRIKENGWYVSMVPSSYAWTSVPETFKGLWIQRVRWVYGGLEVFLRARPLAVLQDVIGHATFIATISLIFAFYFVNPIHSGVSDMVVRSIMWLSFGQVLLWYVFQMWYMRFYPEKNWKDWMLRALILPEFLYANMLSLVLMGAYLFYLFNKWMQVALAKMPIFSQLSRGIQRGFQKFGYSQFWGTR